MQSKLTISLDKELIEEAKAFAKQKGRSLSAMIESYLKVVVENESPSDNKLSPTLKKLKGSVNLPDEGFDYKREIQKTLSKKYKL